MVDSLTKENKMTTHGGKGSAPRPVSISKEQFASNWDTIFGKKKELPKKEMTTYCLGTGMVICNFCQHDANWKYLNNDNIVSDTERLALQKDMLRIDDEVCQLTSGKMFLEKESPKPTGCGNGCAGCKCTED